MRVDGYRPERKLIGKRCFKMQRSLCVKDAYGNIPRDSRTLTSLRISAQAFEIQSSFNHPIMTQLNPSKMIPHVRTLTETLLRPAQQLKSTKQLGHFGLYELPYIIPTTTPPQSEAFDAERSEQRWGSSEMSEHERSIIALSMYRIKSTLYMQ